MFQHLNLSIVGLTLKVQGPAEQARTYSHLKHSIQGKERARDRRGGGHAADSNLARAWCTDRPMRIFLKLFPALASPQVWLVMKVTLCPYARLAALTVPDIC